MPSAAVVWYLLQAYSDRTDSIRRRRRHSSRPRGGGSDQAATIEPVPEQPAVETLLPEQTSANPGQLVVRCFGRFEVWRGNGEIREWRRAKARTLLKFLADRRHPVARDVLIELLWPQSDVGAAMNGFRVALHSLRQALHTREDGTEGEREYLILTDGYLSLNPAAPIWIDAEEFSRHFVAGMRLERQGRLQDAMAEYERAESLYRDDYLIEDLYADWTLARREQLKDQFLLLVTKIADWCFLHDDPLGCIVRCHRILEKDPCREDAYFRLMRCYQQLGRRSQALHWYEVCLRTLQTELDSAPSDATQQLFRSMVGRHATRRDSRVTTVHAVS